MQTKSSSIPASIFPSVRCQTRSGAVPQTSAPSALTRRFRVSSRPTTARCPILDQV
ncbi:hypothetical protein [Streptomyces sp. 3214.6]|uniref:hypothetical protein n=1 Tax=Streptomyces sp. 3214.6 TaxID=1882757 RepID=UPI0013520D74|nr:hypothetical protein [Streptomyces sp. 3214.6]